MSDITVFGNQSYFNDKTTFFDEVQIGENLKIKSGKLLVTSPNGTEYRLIVSNDGTLSTQSVS